MYYVSLASQWCIQYPVPVAFATIKSSWKRIQVIYIITSILHVISSSSFETLQPFVDRHPSQPFKSSQKKTQFNWVQREISEKSKHGNCVAWWHVARRSFFAKRFENWGLPWRISQMALQPLRVLPWRVRQEKLSCWGAKQSYHEMFLINFVCTIIFFLNAFRAFSFLWGASHVAGKRTKAHRINHKKLTKQWQRCSYPSYTFEFLVSWRYYETTSILRVSWWEAS